MTEENEWVKQWEMRADSTSVNKLHAKVLGISLAQSLFFHIYGIYSGFMQMRSHYTSRSVSIARDLDLWNMQMLFLQQTLGFTVRDEAASQDR